MIDDDRAALAERVRHRLVGAAGAAGAVGSSVASGREAAALHAAVRAETSGVVDDAVFERLSRDVAADLRGAGPLEPLLTQRGTTDVLVNGPDSVWFDRGRGMERAGIAFDDDDAVRALAQRLAATAGRRLDDAMPFADAVLADGTRLHAVLAPVAGATTISLRVLARRRYDLADLAGSGTLAPRSAQLVRAIVDARLALVITGGTGTGKTTLLGAMLGEAGADERLLVIEDAPELVVAHPHVVRLVTRPPNVEGAGAIGLRELVRQALRMRPDRLVVGEFRGAETVDLLVALNTGHEGGAATMHANSAGDVPARFAALGALAGLSVAAVTSLVASAVDVVVHLRRGRDGQRRLAELALLDAVEGRLRVVPAWTSEGGDEPGAARLLELLAARGSG